MYLIWGSVYALGFLALHGTVFGWLPISPAGGLLTFGGLTVVGAAVSAVLGIRSGREQRGASSRQGLLYGMAWLASLISLGFITIALTRLVADTAVLYWLVAAIATLVIGVLFMSAGALFGTLPEFFLGAALVVVNIGALLIGPGPLVLVPWLASAAVLFAGAVPAALRGAGAR